MSEKSDEENLTWTEDLNPENYFDWTISKSLQEKKENVNTPQNTNEEVFNSQTNLLSSKGTVVYFDLKTDEGCLREDKNVRNFFFSSKDIFSNDFLVYKGEEVLFNYNNENVENKRPEAFNIVCKSLKRRIMVGEVVFSSHERGFGWISIAIFDKNKPFVFFMEKNVLKKKDDERIEKGDRVRFIVNLEFEQPFASRLELINPVLTRCLANRLSWDKVLSPEYPDEIFSGRVVDITKLILEEYMIMPYNGAGVVYAEKSEVWTSDRGLDLEESVAFVVRKSEDIDDGKYYAQSVITKQKHTGEIVSFDDRSLTGRVKWIEACWLKSLFNANFCFIERNNRLRREFKLGSKIDFELTLVNGNVQIRILKKKPKHDTGKRLTQRKEVEYKKPAQLKFDKTSERKEQDIDKILSEKIRRINLNVENIKKAIERGEDPYKYKLDKSKPSTETNVEGIATNLYESKVVRASERSTRPGDSIARLRGRVIYYSNDFGQISFFAGVGYKNLPVTGEDIWSIDNSLRAGEEVTFYANTSGMRKAFFVQPLNKKRAMLRGKCVYFNAKEKEAAVRRKHSSWPPIGFIVPDVLLDLIDRGKTLLFNVDFTANLKPFVVNLRVE